MRLPERIEYRTAALELRRDDRVLRAMIVIEAIPLGSANGSSGRRCEARVRRTTQTPY